MVGHHAIKTYLKLYTLLTTVLDMGAWLAWCLAITFHREIIYLILCSGNGWDSSDTEVLPITQGDAFDLHSVGGVP